MCLVAQSFRISVTPWTAACQAPLSMGILQARILEWVTMPSIQGSNPYLLHCRWILYCLSHQGSPVGIVKHLKPNSQIDHYHLCSCSTLIFAVFAFYHRRCKESQLCKDTSSKGKYCHIMLKPWITSSSSFTDGVYPCFPQKIKIPNSTPASSQQGCPGTS